MNWKDINIRKGVELYNLELDKFYSNNEQSKLEQQLMIIFDKDIEWVESLPLSEYFKIRGELEFLKYPPNSPFEMEINIDGVEYVFVDDFKDIKNMQAGRFIDLETYGSSLKEDHSNLANMMAVLYTPKGEKYNSNKVSNISKIFMEKMSYETAVGAAVFFSLLGMSCIKGLKEYSLLEMTIMEMLKIQEEKREIVSALR